MCRAGNLYLLCRDCDDAVATGVWHDRCEHYDFHSDTCAEAIEWDSSDERSQRSSIALCDSCDEASQQSSNESTSYAVEVEAALPPNPQPRPPSVNPWGDRPGDQHPSILEAQQGQVQRLRRPAARTDPDRKSPVKTPGSLSLARTCASSAPARPVSDRTQQRYTTPAVRGAARRRTALRNRVSPSKIRGHIIGALPPAQRSAHGASTWRMSSTTTGALSLPGSVDAGQSSARARQDWASSRRAPFTGLPSSRSAAGPLSNVNTRNTRPTVSSSTNSVS
ncbi:hypothetical protein OC834_002389 [Tilletia horrida]|nr:hypothetical protein OC834_002389 [Tilletia horrida]